MIVKCPSCEARFRIPEVKIKPTGTKVRCGKCRTVFRVAMGEVPGDTPQATENPAISSSSALSSGPKSSQGHRGPVNFPGLGDGTLEVPALDASDLEALDERVRVEAIAPQRVTSTGITLPPAVPPMAPKPRNSDATSAGPRPAGIVRTASPSSRGNERTSKPTAPTKRSEAPAPTVPSHEPPSRNDLTPTPTPPSRDESWSADFAAEARPVAPPSYTTPSGDTPGSEALPVPRYASESQDFRSPSASLDATTNPAGSQRALRWMAVAVAALLTVVCFFAFVAMRNDGVLDFGHMDRMFGIAFSGHDYPEPAMRVIRVYEENGQVVEEPAEDVAVRLRIEDVEQSVYMTQNRVPLVLVQGSLRNDGDDPHRNIVVGGRVYSGSSLVGSSFAPVGATATPEDLEAITSDEDVDALYRNLQQNAAEFVINGNEGSLFTLVFPAAEEVLEGDGPLSYEVELVSAEWLADGDSWQRLVSEPDDEAPPR